MGNFIQLLFFVTITNIKAINPMVARAKMKPIICFGFNSGLRLITFSRSFIAVLGEFPAFGLGYLTGYGKFSFIFDYSSA